MLTAASLVARKLLTNRGQFDQKESHNQVGFLWRACPGVLVPVRQRRDDQSVCAAQVLVAVAELHVRDLDDASVRFLQEVKPRLFLPLKVRRGPDVQMHLRGFRKGCEDTPPSQEAHLSPPAHPPARQRCLSGARGW